MAKTVSVVVTDDLDGSDGAKVVAFSYQGTAYEIDLGPSNEAEFAKTLAPFIAAGRRPSGGSRRPARTAALRTDRAAVRAWAKQEGMKISERGRIPADVEAKYQAAH